MKIMTHDDIPELCCFQVRWGHINAMLELDNNLSVYHSQFSVEMKQIGKKQGVFLQLL